FILAPTCALIRPDGQSLEAFGYDAEDRYTELASEDKHRPWYFFKRFKMMLFDKMELHRGTEIEDVLGKKLTAKTAGILRCGLLIALEPESASIYCRHLPAEMCRGTSVSVTTFEPGTKYMVLDAGGKDVLKQFKEKHMENYVDLIRDFEIKKRDISTTGKSNFRLPSALLDLVKEITGKTIKETIVQSVYKESVSFIGDKLRVESKIAMKFFDVSIDSIIAHVSSLIQKPTVSGCSVIVMVGGFSESTLLQDRIRSKFSTMDVISPNEAGTVVLKGAVIFGHNPGAIAQRVLKITYGQEMTHVTKDECIHDHPEADRERDDNGQMRCLNLVDIHARAGQAVTEGQEQPEQVYTPVYDDQTELECSILTSDIGNPIYATDCQEIGKWSFPITDTSLGRKREFGVTFMFGGTEVVVKVVDKVSKAERKIHLDCL
ncbi:HS12A-like protein, partial [Mya arenaria]